MAKVQQISEITPSFAFTEYDFYKDYEDSFKKSEIGRIHSVLPLREMAIRFLQRIQRGNAPCTLRKACGETLWEEDCQTWRRLRLL